MVGEAVFDGGIGCVGRFEGECGSNLLRWPKSSWVSQFTSCTVEYASVLVQRDCSQEDGALLRSGAGRLAEAASPDGAGGSHV